MSLEQIAVVIASAGRPKLLAEVMNYVDRLEGSPFIRVASVPDSTSLPDYVNPDWVIVEGKRGAAAQRNNALGKLPSHVELVFFFDDDAVIRADYLVQAQRVFDSASSVVGLTGRVLADGKTSSEIDRDLAEEIVEISNLQPRTGSWAATRELYGANFAVRWDSTMPVWFDERLPLYSWLEDHDYARQLLTYGSLASVDDCVIVHRAAASGGRTSHLRLGYSQVMNPVYLFRKGTFPLWLLVEQLFRPVAKNLVRTVLPGRERRWRHVRLRGNAMAGLDVMRNRTTPERIVDLGT